MYSRPTCGGNTHNRDGLLGPTDCFLLYPLEETRGFQVERANELRSEHWFPAVLRRLAILGDDGCGNLVCFDPDAGQGVLWNPADGDQVQERRDDVSAIWDLIRRSYEVD